MRPPPPLPQPPPPSPISLPPPQHLPPPPTSRSFIISFFLYSLLFLFVCWYCFLGFFVFFFVYFTPGRQWMEFSDTVSGGSASPMAGTFPRFLFPASLRRETVSGRRLAGQGTFRASSLRCPRHSRQHLEGTRAWLVASKKRQLSLVTSRVIFFFFCLRWTKNMDS